MCGDTALLHFVSQSRTLGVSLVFFVGVNPLRPPYIFVLVFCPAPHGHHVQCCGIGMFDYNFVISVDDTASLYMMLPHFVEYN